MTMLLLLMLLCNWNRTKYEGSKKYTKIMFQGILFLLKLGVSLIKLLCKFNSICPGKPARYSISVSYSPTRVLFPPLSMFIQIHKGILLILSSKLYILV